MSIHQVKLAEYLTKHVLGAGTAKIKGKTTGKQHNKSMTSTKSNQLDREDVPLPSEMLQLMDITLNNMDELGALDDKVASLLVKPMDLESMFFPTAAILNTKTTAPRTPDTNSSSRHLFLEGLNASETLHMGSSSMLAAAEYELGTASIHNQSQQQNPFAASSFLREEASSVDHLRGAEAVSATASLPAVRDRLKMLWLTRRSEFEHQDGQYQQAVASIQEALNLHLGGANVAYETANLSQPTMTHDPRELLHTIRTQFTVFDPSAHIFADRIQRLFRYHMRRRHRHATRISSFYRGHKTRQKVRLQRRIELQCARLIQRRFRVHLQRMHRLATKLKQWYKLRKDVQRYKQRLLIYTQARHIQRLWRGIVGRRRAALRRLRIESSCRIQRAARGYLSRAERAFAISRLHKRLFLAVRCIQRWTRGVQAKAHSQLLLLLQLLQEQSRHDLEARIILEVTRLQRHKHHFYMQTLAGQWHIRVIKAKLETSQVLAELGYKLAVEQEAERKRLLALNTDNNTKQEALQAEEKPLSFITPQILAVLASFDEFDDGIIPRNQLPSLLSKLGVKPVNKSLLLDLHRNLDPNDTGMVSLGLLCDWIDSKDADLYMLNTTPAPSATAAVGSMSSFNALFTSKIVISEKQILFELISRYWRSHLRFVYRRRAEHKPKFSCCQCLEAFPLFADYFAHFVESVDGEGQTKQEDKKSEKQKKSGSRPNSPMRPKSPASNKSSSSASSAFAASGSDSAPSSSKQSSSKQSSQAKSMQPLFCPVTNQRALFFRNYWQSASHWNSQRLLQAEISRKNAEIAFIRKRRRELTCNWLSLMYCQPSSTSRNKQLGFIQDEILQRQEKRLAQQLSDKLLSNRDGHEKGPAGPRAAPILIESILSAMFPSASECLFVSDLVLSEVSRALGNIPIPRMWLLEEGADRPTVEKWLQKAIIIKRKVPLYRGPVSEKKAKQDFTITDQAVNKKIAHLVSTSNTSSLQSTARGGRSPKSSKSPKLGNKNASNMSEEEIEAEEKEARDLLIHSSSVTVPGPTIPKRSLSPFAYYADEIRLISLRVAMAVVRTLHVLREENKYAALAMMEFRGRYPRCLPSDYATTASSDKGEIVLDESMLKQLGLYSLSQRQHDREYSTLLQSMHLATLQLHQIDMLGYESPWLRIKLKWKKSKYNPRNCAAAMRRGLRRMLRIKSPLTEITSDEAAPPVRIDSVQVQAQKLLLACLQYENIAAETQLFANLTSPLGQQQVKRIASKFRVYLQQSRLLLQPTELTETFKLQLMRNVGFAGALTELLVLLCTVHYTAQRNTTANTTTTRTAQVDFLDLDMIKSRLTSLHWPLEIADMKVDNLLGVSEEFQTVDLTGREVSLAVLSSLLIQLIQTGPKPLSNTCSARLLRSLLCDWMMSTRHSPVLSLLSSGSLNVNKEAKIIWLLRLRTQRRLETELLHILLNSEKLDGRQMEEVWKGLELFYGQSQHRAGVTGGEDMPVDSTTSSRNMHASPSRKQAVQASNNDNWTSSMKQWSSSPYSPPQSSSPSKKSPSSRIIRFSLDSPGVEIGDSFAEDHVLREAADEEEREADAAAAAAAEQLAAPRNPDTSVSFLTSSFIQPLFNLSQAEDMRQRRELLTTLQTTAVKQTSNTLRMTLAGRANLNRERALVKAGREMIEAMLACLPPFTSTDQDDDGNNEGDEAEVEMKESFFFFSTRSSFKSSRQSSRHQPSKSMKSGRLSLDKKWLYSPSSRLAPGTANSNKSNRSSDEKYQQKLLKSVLDSYVRLIDGDCSGQIDGWELTRLLQAMSLSSHKHSHDDEEDTEDGDSGHERRSKALAHEEEVEEDQQAKTISFTVKQHLLTHPHLTFCLSSKHKTLLLPAVKEQSLAFNMLVAKARRQAASQEQRSQLVLTTDGQVLRGTQLSSTDAQSSVNEAQKSLLFRAQALAMRQQREYQSNTILGQLHVQVLALTEIPALWHQAHGRDEEAEEQDEVQRMWSKIYYAFLLHSDSQHHDQLLLSELPHLLQYLRQADGLYVSGKWHSLVRGVRRGLDRGSLQWLSWEEIAALLKGCFTPAAASTNNKKSKPQDDDNQDMANNNNTSFSFKSSYVQLPFSFSSKLQQQQQDYYLNQDDERFQEHYTDPKDRKSSFYCSPSAWRKRKQQRQHKQRMLVDAVVRLEALARQQAALLAAHVMEVDAAETNLRCLRLAWQSVASIMANDGETAMTAAEEDSEEVVLQEPDIPTGTDDITAQQQVETTEAAPETAEANESVQLVAAESNSKAADVFTLPEIISNPVLPPPPKETFIAQELALLRLLGEGYELAEVLACDHRPLLTVLPLPFSDEDGQIRSQLVSEQQLLAVAKEALPSNHSWFGRIKQRWRIVARGGRYRKQVKELQLALQRRQVDVELQGGRYLNEMLTGISMQTADF